MKKLSVGDAPKFYGDQFIQEEEFEGAKRKENDDIFDNSWNENGNSVHHASPISMFSRSEQFKNNPPSNVGNMEGRSVSFSLHVGSLASEILRFSRSTSMQLTNQSSSVETFANRHLKHTVSLDNKNGKQKKVHKQTEVNSKFESFLYYREVCYFDSD